MAKGGRRFGPRAIAAGIVALGAAGFAWWSVRPFVRPSPGPGRAEARVADADAEALKDASFVAATGEPVATVVARFAGELGDRLASLNGSENLTIPRSDQLRELASERLALYLNPRFEDYAEHVERLTGVRPPASEREAWERMAKAYEGVAIDPSRVDVRPLFIEGQEAHRVANDGGHITFRRDSGRYSRVDNPKNTGADVYAVFVPMHVEARSRNGAEPIPTTVFFVMEYVYNDELGHWRPWRTGVYDPADGGALLPGPWL